MCACAYLFFTPSISSEVCHNSKVLSRFPEGFLGSSPSCQHHLADSWKNTPRFIRARETSALMFGATGRRDKAAAQSSQASSCVSTFARLSKVVHPAAGAPYSPSALHRLFGFYHHLTAAQAVNQDVTGRPANTWPLRKLLVKHFLPLSARQKLRPPRSRFLRCGQGNVKTSGRTSLTETFRTRPTWSVRSSSRCPK